MQPAIAAADVGERHALEAVQQLPDRRRREQVQVRGVVLRRAAAEEAQAALEPERVRDGADEHAAGPEDAPRLGDERLRERQVLEQLAGDDGVEARVRERERLLDVRHHGLDAERLGLRERRAVDVEADDLVPLEEVPGQRARAAPEVEDALPAPDRRPEERDALGDEDEVALVAPLPMVLLVPLAERAHAEPTGASWPSEAIVRRRPSSSSTSGPQPRSWRARVMSG